MGNKGILLFGVGINDANYPVRVLNKDTGKYSRCPYHTKWAAMVTRCFSKAYQSEKPSYINCSLANEWIIFSNFRKWMESQDWQGKHLDKDILNEGNKHYSPENCCFVDQLTNSFIVDSAGSRGEFPIGVYFNKRRNKFHARCGNPLTKRSNEHIGYFESAEEAHEAWKKRKLELAFFIAEMQTDKRVAEAIIRRYS